MKTEHLQYLIQLSQCKSISLAAEKCHISQQALSAAIKQLEQELEAPLLIRSYQGVTLTPQGKETLAYAKLVLHQYDLLKAKLKTAAPSPEILKGNLQVLAGPATITSVLYHFLPDFCQKYPHVSLDLRDMEISNIYAAMSKVTIQSELNSIGIVHTPPDQLNNVFGEYLEQLEFTPLLDEKLIAYVSKYSELAKHKKLSVSTLLKHPLVMFVPEDLQANIIYNMLLPYGQPKISLTTGNPYIFCSSIAQNVGIGIVPAVTATNPIMRESLQDTQMIHLKENLHTTYGYLLPKGAALSPALQAFAEALQTYDFR